TVLARTGFGDHPRLAQSPCQEGLTHAVVDLVSAGVIEIFALEVDLRAAKLLRPTSRVIDRTRSSDVVFELVGEFGDEIGIPTITCVLLLELFERMDQGLGDKHAAVGPEMTALVGKAVGKITHLHCAPRG